jgi:hypothetical protein
MEDTVHSSMETPVAASASNPDIVRSWRIPDTGAVSPSSSFTHCRIIPRGLRH